jgi:hypothetical protein
VHSGKKYPIEYVTFISRRASRRGRKRLGSWNKDCLRSLKSKTLTDTRGQKVFARTNKKAPAVPGLDQ